MFEGHNASVRSVAFSPDGKSILTGSADNTAILWDREGKPIQKFEGHQFAVNSVAFSPDGKSVLTGSYDHTAILWEKTIPEILNWIQSPDCSVGQLTEEEKMRFGGIIEAKS